MGNQVMKVGLGTLTGKIFGSLTMIQNLSQCVNVIVASPHLPI